MRFVFHRGQLSEPGAREAGDQYSVVTRMGHANMSDTHRRTHRLDRRGAGFALLAAVLFGASTPFAKQLLHGATPQLLAGLLYLGSGLGLAAAWRAWGRRRGEAQLSRGDALWLAGAIAFGGVLGPLLLMLGLTRTPASSASLLLNLEGAFTALLAWFVFRENVDRRIALGMLAIVAGGVVLSWEGRVAWGGLSGPLLVAGACACWAIDNNLTQKVSAGDPMQIAMLKGLVAGSVNVVLALALGVWLHLTEQHEHLHVHEALEHEHLHVHDAHHQHAHEPNDPPGEPHTHWHRHEPPGASPAMPTSRSAVCG